MRLLPAAILLFSGSAWAQSPPPSTCNATQILSVDNFAAGGPANSLGGIARISWCDFEFPAPTTQLTSVLVHGRPAFITLQQTEPTSPVTSVILHGYPSYVPRQIVVQLPNLMATTDSASLELLRGAQTVASTSVQIQEFAPGIFTMDGTPNGPAVAWSSPMNYIVQGNPARPGQVVTLFCEGLGPTFPFVPAGSVPSGMAISTTFPQIYVGNQLAPVILSRLSSSSGTPSAAGVYEVSFVVPALSSGNQPIYLTIGGQTSNAATLAVTQ